jgi:hypothetical protein
MDDPWQAWLAWLDERPERVAAVARRYPPLTETVRPLCYRSTEDPRYHYTILSYGEPTDSDDKPVTMTLIHGHDSTLPGVATFGQDPSQLIACGCGQWKPPTPEQARRTHAYMQRMARLRRGN